MLERLSMLSGYDYFYAAMLAFLITYIFMRFMALKKEIKNKDEMAVPLKARDKNLVVEKCVRMFPIETISFNGKVFKRGMIVRITTMQKKVFQGEFIGKNDMDIICIMTNTNVIAHEIKKVSDMIYVEEQANDIK